MHGLPITSRPAFRVHQSVSFCAGIEQDFSNWPRNKFCQGFGIEIVKNNLKKMCLTQRLNRSSELEAHILW